MNASIRTAIESLPGSRIREVANAGFSLPDVLKFWVGEGDLPTPQFIRDAAIAALQAGDTFYSHNLGMAELREAIAQYLNDLYAPMAETLGADRIAVTSAGVNALALASQMVLDPGDRVAIVTPVWPNLTEFPRIMSANVVRVPLTCTADAWTLDLDRLLDAARGAKMVLVNSPNNPTGWVMPQPQWDALLALCRRHGIWLASDDAYARLVYDGAPHAPGVLSQVTDEDRFLSANTFSKSWTMTGWRLGWLLGPRRFVEQLGKVIEFNTSCAPPFVQRAGLAAVRDGEPLVAETVARLRHARDVLVQRLRQVEGVHVAPPPGAMYLFFRVPGAGDSLALAKDLLARARLGLAPGSAFGEEGEGYLRWCFAASPELLVQGVERLERYLAASTSPRAFSIGSTLASRPRKRR